MSEEKIKVILEKFELWYKNIDKELVDNIFQEVEDKIIVSISDYDDANKFEETINTIAKAVKEGEKLDEIIKCLKSKYEENNMINCIEKIVKLRIVPYTKSEFFREMKFRDRYIFLKEIFENQFIQRDYIESTKKRLSEEIGENLGVKEIQMGIKIMGFIQNLIVENRVSKERFICECKEYFGFEECDIDLLWDLFQENKQQLSNQYIIDSILKIKETINGLKDNGLNEK